MPDSTSPTKIRSLEFSEGTSDKFWTIELRGNVHHVHFGRKGTAGQKQTKEFASDEAARKAFDKLVAEKMAKGYRDLDAPDPKPESPPSGTANADPAALEPPAPPAEPEHIRLLREKVTPEDAESCFALGKALEAIGQGNAPEEARLWYVHATFLQHPAAFYQLAGDCRLFGLKDLSRAFLDEALRKGHPDTKNHIGIWRIEDFGHEEDQQGFHREEPARIKDLREDAIVSHSSDCLEMGEALVTLDSRAARIEALFWFLKAALLREEAAHYHIGRFFHRWGNRPFAEFHFALAAKRGHEEATKLLKNLRGIVDEPEEITNLRERAATGDAASCYHLAEALLMYNPNNQEEAIRWYSEAARGHHPDGLFRMALYYRDHDGLGLAATYLEDAEKRGHQLAGATHRQWQVEGLLDFKNEKEAISLLEWGVTLGMDIARCRLAERLLEGRGVKENPVRAAKLYEDAGKNGHAPSMYELAHSYQTGRGVLRDSTLALEWMKKAAEAGDPNGIHGLGVIYLESGRQPDALDCFRRAAEMNHPAALAALADAAARGEGVPADQAESHRLTAKAAEAGDAGAQFRLAELYSSSGPGFEQDLERAEEWYQRAAGQDHAVAMRRLGELRLAGKPSKKLLEEAWNYIHRAAKLGDVAAMLEYARKLERSRDPNREYWYRQAADLGNAEAQFITGKRMQSVSHEREAGRRYLKAAAAQGHAEAQALLDQSESEPESNSAEGAELLAAAIAGDKASQFSLAMWYYVGNCFAQNYASSYFWARILKKSKHEQVEDMIKMVGPEVPAPLRKKIDQLAAAWKTGTPPPPLE